MVNDNLAQVLPLLRQLVESGAEVEQRTLDGEPVPTGTDAPESNVFPLARDTLHYTSGASDDEDDPGDGQQRLWLRPLYGCEPTASGQMAFDGPSHQARPIEFTRLDLLGAGNVGIQHPTGTYSVVRALTSEVRRRLVDAWDNGIVNY